MNNMNEILAPSFPECSNCGSPNVSETPCQNYPNDYSTEKTCLDCGATEA